MSHLILSRRVGQSIRIGNDTVVTVISFQGAQARIGIRAPREIYVLRAELPKIYPSRTVGPSTRQASKVDNEVPHAPAVTYRKRKVSWKF